MSEALGEPLEAGKLERETCGRCGGSGHYSYCQRYGTTCFGCGGKGLRLTKRGAVAAQFLRTLRSVPASEIKVGDLVEVGGVTGGGDVYDYFARVVEIKLASETGYRAWSVDPTTGEQTEHDTSKSLAIYTEHAKFGRSGRIGVAPDSTIRKGWTTEEKAEQLKKALEFQATLTKKGTPRVRKAAL